MNISVLFDETLFLSDDELCIKSITKKDADDFSKIYLIIVLNSLQGLPKILMKKQ